MNILSILKEVDTYLLVSGSVVPAGTGSATPQTSALHMEQLQKELLEAGLRRLQSSTFWA